MSQAVLILGAAVMTAFAVFLLIRSRPLPRQSQRMRLHAGATYSPRNSPLARLRANLHVGTAAEIATHTRALRQLAALLEAGRTPGEAWEALASVPAGDTAASGDTAETQRRKDVAEAARAARAAQALGRPASEGLARFACGESPYRATWERAVWCLRLSEETGAPLAALLERLAEQVEASRDQQQARESALAGPRMTARMLATLPAVGLLLAMLLGANPVALFLSHPLAQLSLVLGAIFWAANQVWTQRILHAAGAGATGREPRLSWLHRAAAESATHSGRRPA